MTARVMLALDQDEALDGEWLGALLAWDLSGLSGECSHARSVAMIAMVASRRAAVLRGGLAAWPTLCTLAAWLNSDATNWQIRHALTVAVAADWLVYQDDGLDP